MNNLNSLSDKEFFNLIKTEEESITFAQELGLLKRKHICCGKEVPLRINKRDKNKGYFFRCTVKNCRKEVSLRKNSFFEGSHLLISQILTFIYYFVYDETTLKGLKRKCGVTRDETVVDWLSYCREVCTLYFLKYPIVVGGFGKIVEVDEMAFVRRKYNRGHLVRTQWVFGGYDVESKEGFMVSVDACDRETLFPIIQKFVRPGTIIHSDCAKVYEALPFIGHPHDVVNHSENFVNPITGATTNHVESMWQKAKGKNKSRFGTHRTTLDGHLTEFLWRQRYKFNLELFVDVIREFYNPNISE